MKAGTTTLYRYLMAHHEVCMSRAKETDYFIQNKNFSLGEAWYRSQFSSGFKIYGEASPNYTMRDVFIGVAENLSRASPDAKLIFVARDPVARFVSQCNHLWLLGHMSVTPNELLTSKAGQDALKVSFYNHQMQPFLDHFPRENLLILDFEDLKTAPQAVFDQVCHHIGASQMPVPDIGAQNDAASLARMPGWVQRFWQSKAARRLDPIVSRGVRDVARKLLSQGPQRTAPELTPDILETVSEAVTEDANAFRALSGLPFSDWRI